MWNVSEGIYHQKTEDMQLTSSENLTELVKLNEERLNKLENPSYVTNIYEEKRMEMALMLLLQSAPF